MSDQRLYRGKTEAGEWVKGWYCVWQGISLIFDSPFNLLHNPVEVIPASVAQSTGCPDEDGTEIFAGDIIKSEFNGIGIYLVVWVDLWAGYFRKVIRKSDYEPNGSLLQPLSSDGSKDHKVIGNTTDNPELLEEQEK